MGRGGGKRKEKHYKNKLQVHSVRYHVLRTGYKSYIICNITAAQRSKYYPLNGYSNTLLRALPHLGCVVHLQDSLYDV